MTDTSQNRFLDSVIDYAKDSGGVFIIANALLQRNPIIYCSQSFSRQTGFTRSEVTRKDAFLYFLCGNHTSLSSREALKNAVLSKSKTQIEMILYNVAGHKKWYLVALIPVKDLNNVVSLLTIFFHDISYIKSPLIASPRLRWKKAVKKILNKPTHEDIFPNNKTSLSTLYNYYDTLFIPEYGCKLKVPKYVISHSSPAKMLWDFFILVISFIYTAVIIPFVVCVNYKSRGMTAFDLVCNVFVVIDIVTTFFTSFVDDDGVLVTNLPKIRLRYLKTWFAFDFLSALPYGLLDYTSNKHSKLITIVRVVKVFRLVRLVKVKDILAQYLENGVITLAIWILVFCLCAHWMACIWILIAREVDIPNERSDSWLFTMVSQYNSSSYINITDFQVDNQSRTLVYVSALYYSLSSLTTCGFGNIAPNTFAEKVFGVVTMVFGCLMYAFIFGQVTNIISQLSETTNEYMSQLRAIRQFNSIYKIPKEIRNRVEHYFISSWAVTKGTEEEKIMSKFPRSLQSDLCFHIHGDVFKNEPAFRHLSKNALRALSRFFWTLRTSPGDKIIYQGELVTSIYFVTCGSFEVKDGSSLIGLIGPGDSFGLRPVMEPSKSICEVQANSFGEIHGVSIDGIFESLSLFPMERDLFKYTFKLSFDITKKINNKPKSMAFDNKTKLFDKKPTTFDKNFSADVKKETDSEKDVTDIDHVVSNRSEDSNVSASFLNVSANFLNYSYHKEKEISFQTLPIDNIRNEFNAKTNNINAKIQIIETQMKIILDLLQKTNSSNNKDNWETFFEDDNKEWHSNKSKQSFIITFEAPTRSKTAVIPFNDSD
ncbi:potassium voltage-gated channel subfamily H member 6 isoform X1 [Hydra vulgaris]|uniref:potassium voltage-gated channel subfamily H member 6 isoform X1 n=1 Tax=Hydra vulgaris TaxID=6087 RepID=UPI001F5EAF37|nr:potassium voltage-gated channel subfamily H member 6-like [Hydra vulgaris]